MILTKEEQDTWEMLNYVPFIIDDLVYISGNNHRSGVPAIILANGDSLHYVPDGAGIVISDWLAVEDLKSK